MTELENATPTVRGKALVRPVTEQELDEEIEDELDAREVFDLIRDINDPEHPLTLEELDVVDESRVSVDANKNRISVEFKPTIPHCSMATLIGLAIRVKLLRSLQPKFKVTVGIVTGSHVSDLAITKQLNDKERVAAALENSQLINVVNQCLTPRD